MSDESFIPWEQIAPLVRPGMTFGDLCVAVIDASGLPRERYKVAGCLTIQTTLIDCLRRGGLRIYRIDEWWKHVESGQFKRMGSAVIA